MFQINESAFGPYTLYRFEDDTAQNGFSVVPEIGGTLIDLWFNGQSVLDGYESPEALEEGKWGKSAILFPFPNRLLDGRYTWGGQTYQFPINNAATGNAIHGFARHHAFVLEQATADENSAACTLVQAYDGHLPYYPFPCRLSLRLVLHSNQTFEVEVTVDNLHSASIPFGFGWHPYFRLTPAVGDTVLRFPTCHKVGIDDRMIPTGERTTFADFDAATPIEDTVLDNCFALQSDLSAQLRAGGRILAMKADRVSFPYFQIFTPPARTSVAFEPMTCNVDALNNGNGLQVLKAGARWTGSFVVEYRQEVAF